MLQIILRVVKNARYDSVIAVIFNKFLNLTHNQQHGKYHQPVIGQGLLHEISPFVLLETEVQHFLQWKCVLKWCETSASNLSKQQIPNTWASYSNIHQQIHNNIPSTPCLLNLLGPNSNAFKYNCRNINLSGLWKVCPVRITRPQPKKHESYTRQKMSVDRYVPGGLCK